MIEKNCVTNPYTRKYRRMLSPPPPPRTFWGGIFGQVQSPARAENQDFMDSTEN